MCLVNIDCSWLTLGSRHFAEDKTDDWVSFLAIGNNSVNDEQKECFWLPLPPSETGPGKVLPSTPDCLSSSDSKSPVEI